MDTTGKKGIGRKNRSQKKKGKLQVENIETGTEEWTSQGSAKHYNSVFKTQNMIDMILARNKQ